MNKKYDAIIVGSGASGVSAAWPLVNAGLKVLMLDQGKKEKDSTPQHTSFLKKRKSDDNQWKVFLGKDFSGISSTSSESPKFKVPAHKFILSGFREEYKIDAKGVLPTGSLAQGGVTGMWGAGPYNYRGVDLDDFPFDPTELDLSHKEVAKRIGINGVNDDDLSELLGKDLPLQQPMSLHKNAQIILDKYTNKYSDSDSNDVLIGRARNAVLSTAKDGREACTEDAMCFWGCDKQAIYSAGQELQLLMKFENFNYLDKSFVEKIEKFEGDYKVYCRDVDGIKDSAFFSCGRILLAAGTIGSTILAMRLLEIFDKEVPLICHPAYAKLFLIPKRLGHPLTENKFALGQLAYKIKDRDNPKDYVFGVLFALEGLLAQDIARHMPFTASNSIQLTKILTPSLVVANGYLSGDYANATIKIDSVLDRVIINGGRTKSFYKKMKWATNKLSKMMSSLGALPMPFGTRIATLGSDGHFAGTFPMTKGNIKNTTSPDGELRGAAGVYMVDGSSIPYLSGKHPTFTIMANANRISKEIVKNDY
jgi:choline dehydrogenase-like flavoprotein